MSPGVNHPELSIFLQEKLHRCRDASVPGAMGAPVQARCKALHRQGQPGLINAAPDCQSIPPTPCSTQPTLQQENNSPTSSCLVPYEVLHLIKSDYWKTHCYFVTPCSKYIVVANLRLKQVFLAHLLCVLHLIGVCPHKLPSSQSCLELHCVVLTCCVDALGLQQQGDEAK